MHFRHPGGTKLCLLCKLEDNHLNCQGPLKWFPVKSKRGPGRPKDKGLPKTPRLMATFLSNTLEIAPAPKVITLKTEAGAHSEPIKIKIDMTKGGECLPNGNGFLDPDVIDSCGFYIHVECCRWTTSVAPEIEMFKAERYLLKGLGQVCYVLCLILSYQIIFHLLILSMKKFTNRVKPLAATLSNYPNSTSELFPLHDERGYSELPV